MGIAVRLICVGRKGSAYFRRRPQYQIEGEGLGWSGLLHREQVASALGQQQGSGRQPLVSLAEAHAGQPKCGAEAAQRLQGGSGCATAGRSSCLVFVQSRVCSQLARLLRITSLPPACPHPRACSSRPPPLLQPPLRWARAPPSRRPRPSPTTSSPTLCPRWVLMGSGQDHPACGLPASSDWRAAPQLCGAGSKQQQHGCLHPGGRMQPPFTR